MTTEEKKTLPAISWPQAAVLIVLVAGAVVSAIFAPEDIRIALAALLTTVAGVLRVLK